MLDLRQILQMNGSGTVGVLVWAAWVSGTCHARLLPRSLSSGAHSVFGNSPTEKVSHSLERVTGVDSLFFLLFLSLRIMSKLRTQNEEMLWTSISDDKGGKSTSPDASLPWDFQICEIVHFCIMRIYFLSYEIINFLFIYPIECELSITYIQYILKW